MKYFIFTYDGDSLSIAHKLQAEGHEVKVGHVADIQDTHSDSEGKINPEDSLSKGRRLSLYDNMLHKADAWELIEEIRKMKDHNDCFVFFDRNNLFKFANKVRHFSSLKGNFPTEEDYLFEQNRDASKKFVKKYYPKIHVADVYDFKTIDECKNFLDKTNDLWVLKGKDEAAATFVPDVTDTKLAARQILQVLEASKQDYESAGFILELMISPVVEITPEKIYYDGKPIAITIDIENKPFGSGNSSIQTGCAQDLVFPISFKDKIHDIAFPPIIDEMAKKRKGLFYWDASLLIDKRSGKIYFGEFCSNRPGINALYTELAQCPSVHHYFSSLSHKKNPFTLGTVGTSVTIFNPARDETNQCHPPRGARIDFKPTVEKNLWLWDVYKKNTDDHRLLSAGDDWYVAVITGSGKSIDEAVNKMYKDVDDFSFAGSYNRPKFDYVSLDYPTSIPNRLNYGLDRGLYQLPFNVKVGEIKAK